MKCKSKFSLNDDELVNLFKALGDKNRLSIFKHLCDCTLNGTTKSSVSDVNECCDIDLSVVSRHLATLKKAGVLKANKEGKQVLYSLNGKSLANTLRELADSIENCCGESCN